MANNVTVYFEQMINQFLTDMCFVCKESTDLEKMYWGTSIATDLPASGTDPATVNSKLTKDEIVSGLTLAVQLNAFFGNLAVSQGDYYATLVALMNGDDPASSVLGESLESFGDRLVNLSTICHDKYFLAQEILNIYSNQKISNVIGQLDNEDVLFGTDLTKDQVVLFITLVEQYKKLIGNEAVTTADYKSTLSLKPRS